MNKQDLKLKWIVLLIFALNFGSIGSSKAQIAITGGVNISSIRNKTVIENKRFLINSSLGLSVQVYPFKNFQNTSVLIEPSLVRKGYRQRFEKDYSFEFSYISLPILLNYPLTTRFAVNTGVEFSKLYSTNVKQGLKTYNLFDVGLLAGLNYQLSNRLSLYSRFGYGLLPLLDYYEIDELGNFNKEIHDLKNMCLLFGLKFNLSHEKILLFR